MIQEFNMIASPINQIIVEWVIPTYFSTALREKEMFQSEYHGGVKLADHIPKIVKGVMKVCRVTGHYKRDAVWFRERTWDWMPILRHLQEKYSDKSKDLYPAFIDLGKTFC